MNTYMMVTKVAGLREDVYKRQEDTGVQLASADPAEVFACLDRWPREALRADPTALLVLMRRAFSWREIPRMLALRDLLLEAAEDVYKRQAQGSQPCPDV